MDAALEDDRFVDLSDSRLQDSSHSLEERRSNKFELPMLSGRYVSWRVLTSQTTPG